VRGFTNDAIPVPSDSQRFGPELHEIDDPCVVLLRDIEALSDDVFLLDNMSSKLTPEELLCNLCEVDAPAELVDNAERGKGCDSDHRTSQQTKTCSKPSELAPQPIVESSVDRRREALLLAKREAVALKRAGRLDDARQALRRVKEMQAQLDTIHLHQTE
jgi:hypothetical protein